MFPDLNQILKHLNGKLNLVSMIKFLWLKKRNTMTRARGMLMGVIPRFQKLGIESAFILKVREAIEHKPHYKEVEFSWVGDFNPKMISIYEAIGAQKAKTHLTLRYMIDDTIPFKMYKDEMEENKAAREAKLKN